MTQDRAEQFDPPRSSKEAYLGFLQLPTVPRSVEQMPERIYLPGEVLGDMATSVIATRTSRREHSQAVYYRKGTYSKGQVYQGTLHHTNPRYEARTFFKGFWNKALVRYHIHPSGYHQPSFMDIVSFATYPHRAYIEMVVTESSVSALFQTRKLLGFKPPFLPICTTALYLLISDYKYDMGEVDAAQILGRLGFAYYVWDPPAKVIKPEHLIPGISLEKI